MTHRSFGLFGTGRQSSATPAAAAAQAVRQGHKTQRGRRGVQIVAPRSIIACAKSPARRSGTNPRRAPATGVLPPASVRRRHKAGRRRARHCRRPPPFAGRTRLPQSPRRCSRRSPAMRAMPRARREKTAVPFGDGAGASVQVAGARVIAEALPLLQDLVERGRRERRNVGPARHEPVEIRAHGGDGRLLQHDLAEPDAIRVGRARAAPATAGRGGDDRTRRAAAPGRECRAVVAIRIRPMT